MDGDGLIACADSGSTVSSITRDTGCGISAFTAVAAGYRSIDRRSDLAVTVDTGSAVSAIFAFCAICTVATDHLCIVSDDKSGICCITTGSDTGRSIRMFSRTVSTLDRTVDNLQLCSGMFIYTSILHKIKSGLRCIIIICLVTCDGMSAKVNLDLTPGIRDFNGVVDVFLHNYLVVAVIIHYNLYIGVFCFFRSVRSIIAFCITGTSVLELLCDILCIHEGCFTVYRTILAVADLIWCCFLQACDGCFSIPIRQYG